MRRLRSVAFLLVLACLWAMLTSMLDKPLPLLRLRYYFSQPLNRTETLLDSEN
jgi:hypothetical protein